MPHKPIKRLVYLMDRMLNSRKKLLWFKDSVKEVKQNMNYSINPTKLHQKKRLIWKLNFKLLMYLLDRVKDNFNNLQWKTKNLKRSMYYLLLKTDPLMVKSINASSQSCNMKKLTNNCKNKFKIILNVTNKQENYWIENKRWMNFYKRLTEN